MPTKHFRFTFFETSDIKNQRIEYDETNTLFQAVVNADQMKGIGWEVKTVDELHEPDMTDLERKRFNYPIFSMDSVERNVLPG